MLPDFLDLAGGEFARVEDPAHLVDASVEHLASDEEAQTLVTGRSC